MFTVKIIARPDARMVEVPLEFECELPREFDGQAVLASSGVPRKVHLKAGKDGVKISTAYRADVLVADIVRLALRGSVGEMTKVQESAQRFVRLVRERRQDGAALIISLNGAKIEVAESGTSSPGPARPAPPAVVAPAPIKPGPASAVRPGPAVAIVKAPAAGSARPVLPAAALRPGPAAAQAVRPAATTPFATRPPPPIAAAPAAPAPDPALLEKLSALERRISQLEAALPRLLEARDDGGLAARLGTLEQVVESASVRHADLDQRVEGVHGELRAAEAESATRIGLLQQRIDHVLPPLWQDTQIGADPRRGTPRKSTAVDAFAQGLRVELRGRIATSLEAGNAGLPRLDKAAALAAEAALSLGVPAAIAEEARSLAGQTAARHQALQRLSDEVDFYDAADLPVAALLVERLERQPVPDAAPALRAVIAAAGTGPVDEAHLAEFLERAAAVSGDELYQAAAGEPFDPSLHEPSAKSEPRGTVARTIAAGVKRKDGAVLRRPRVESSERSSPPPAEAQKADSQKAESQTGGAQTAGPQGTASAPIEEPGTALAAAFASALQTPSSEREVPPADVAALAAPTASTALDRPSAEGPANPAPPAPPASAAPLALPASADAPPLPAPAESRGSAPPPSLAPSDARIFPALPLDEHRPDDASNSAQGQLAPAAPAPEAKPAEETIVELAAADQIDELEEVEPLATGPILDLPPEAIQAAANGGTPVPPGAAAALSSADAAAAPAGAAAESSPTAPSAAPSDSSASATGAARGSGDLWGEVNSDSAWASITLDKDGPGDDPWGTPVEKSADAPAAASDAATPPPRTDVS